MTKKSLVVAGCVLAGVAFFGFVSWLPHCMADRQAGTPASAWLAEPAPGRLIAVLEDRQDVSGENVEIHQVRVVAVELATGERIAKRTIAQAHQSCRRVGAHLLCSTNRELELVDPLTLDTVRDVDAALRDAAGVEPTDRIGIDHERAEALVLLEDGRVARIGASGAPRIDPKVRDVTGADRPHDCRETSEVTLRGRTWTERAVGARTAVWWSASVETAPTFVYPHLLVDPRTGASLGGDAGVVVLHSEKIGSSSSSRLSLVDGPGTPRWTVDFGKSCMAAWRVGDATKNIERRLFAIDAATGAIAWSVGF